MMEWPEEWKFQNDDVPFFLSHPKSLILYQPRLGKTVVTCKVLALDDQTNTVLIACSKNAFATWMAHIPSAFAKYAPNKTIETRVIRGKNNQGAAERRKRWLAPRTADVTVYIITFAALINDYEFLESKHARFGTIIGDEVHTKLKNRKTKSSIIFRKLVAKARRFHALSGTLTGKWGPADFWGILNMCNKTEFSSYWKFVHMFCHVVDNGFGYEVVGVKNVEEFHRILDRYARIRNRKKERPQMPDVVRKLTWVEPTKEQAKAYEELGESQITLTPSGNLIVAANSLENAMRKRQILACPQMLDESMGVGAAMEDILRQLEEAKENEDVEGQHIVIYSAFRRALPFWERYLRNNGYSNVYQLYGGIEPEDLTKTIEAFTRTNGIILCSTKFAQAFSLASAKVCYHIGYEYDPNDNTQADDRLVPVEGDYSINSFYYGYVGTDDEFLAEHITMKHQLIKQTETDPRNQIGIKS